MSDIEKIIRKLKEKDREVTDLYDKGEGDFQYADYYRGYIDALTDAISICVNMKEGD